MRGLLGWIYIWLFVGFFVVGLLALPFGLLGSLDDWLESNSGAFDAVGSRLVNVLCGGVLVVCVWTVLGGLWERFMAPRSRLGDAADFAVQPAPDGEVEEHRPPGWGCMFGALIVGYFAWVGMMG